MRLFIFITITTLAPWVLRAQSFTFDFGTEGWTTDADGSGVSWVNTGGNPDGWISAYDVSTGGTWHWVAPPIVLGNMCGSYGLTLSFDIKTSEQVTNNTKPDIILTGNGLEIVYNLPFDPLTIWTHYEVVLQETAGWRLNTVSGPVPTKAQFLGVLSNLEKLRIRGEYLQQAVDNGGLDNVLVGTPTFEFDLDQDDSTTPLGSKNFINDTACVDGAKMSDLDLKLLSDLLIDSIVLELVMPQDGNAEQLAFVPPFPATGPNVVGDGTKKMILVNAGQNTASLFRAAIKQIEYRNTALAPSEGVRVVSVTVYTVCGAFGQAAARIPFFPTPFAGDDGAAEFCPNDNATDLKNYLGGDYSNGGIWQPAFVNGQTFDPQLDSLRTYQYLVGGNWEGCPPDTAEVTIRIASPIGDLGNDTTLCKGETLRLSLPLQPDFIHWEWSTGQTGPSILVNKAGTYTVTVTSEIGNCTFSDQIEVGYYNCEPCNVYIPNVFSPDDDGHNDRFRGYSNCPFLQYHMRVFDRWGSLVFETNDPDSYWAGNVKEKELAPGVFVWLLDYQTEFLGENVSGHQQGDVTIVK